MEDLMAEVDLVEQLRILVGRAALEVVAEEKQ